jgi:hypothetical protein
LFILSLIPIIIIGSTMVAIYEEYKIQATGALDTGKRQRIVREAHEMIEALNRETNPIISR